MAISFTADFCGASRPDFVGPAPAGPDSVGSAFISHDYVGSASVAPASVDLGFSIVGCSFGNFTFVRPTSGDLYVSRCALCYSERLFYEGSTVVSAIIVSTASTDSE